MVYNNKQNRPYEVMPSLLSLFPPANVHRLCPELQVHLSERSAHHKLHATHNGRDVLLRYARLLPTCFHLHPSASYPSPERHEHEKKGETDVIG